MGNRQAHRGPAIAAAAVAVATIALTVTGGPRLSSDSLSYIAFGDTGRTALGDPYLWWPPLYPLLVAVWTPVTTVLVAAVSNGAIAAAAAVMARRVVASPTVAAAAGVLVGLAWPTLFFGSFARTEAPFTALALWFCIALDDRRVYAAAAFAGAAAMTRYTGVSCILVGVVILAAARDRRWWRFAAVASAPLAVWLGRNLVLYGSGTGDRPSAVVGVVENLTRAGEATAGWVLGPDAPALFAVVWVVALVVARRDLPAPVVWAAAYIGVVVAGASLVGMDPINGRLLYPVFPILVVAAVATAAKVPLDTAAPATVAVLTVVQITGHVVRPIAEHPRTHDSASVVLDSRLEDCRPASWDCLADGGYGSVGASQVDNSP